MARDPIVEAVRRVRERHAAKFNYEGLSFGAHGACPCLAFL